MGYDFDVCNGRLLSEKKAMMLCNLTGLAAQLELEWSALDGLLSGDVEYCEHNSEWRPKVAIGDISYAVVPSRPWELHDSEVDRIFQTHSYRAPIFEEHIQGIVIHHPYENWVFMWNLTHGNTLGYYSFQVKTPGRSTDEIFPRRSGMLTTSKAETLFASGPLPMTGSWGEHYIHLHTPWRRGDVIAAVEALRVLEAASDNFYVHDHYGVWQHGIGAWKNLGDNYASQLGGKLAYPDESRLLGETPLDPEQQ